MREPSTAFTERKTILWTSPPVSPCPGDGHHNWTHGKDACECGAITAEDVETEEVGDTSRSKGGIYRGR